MRFIFNLCDRVAVLVQGEKLVEGTSDVVQADERVVAAYLGTPYEGAPGDDEATAALAAETTADAAGAADAADSPAPDPAPASEPAPDQAPDQGQAPSADDATESEIPGSTPSSTKGDTQ
jgi:branched-chain amino acid transport system ATP-binding protein